MLTKKQLDMTYVVIEDITTRWGFVGFDTDPSVQFIGTRKACADWIVENCGEYSHELVSMHVKKYEEQYLDEATFEEEN
ncbi:MAG: hypothetical protein JW384_04199 [Nitrosomonadaceae bacterium]|nr:hypothetical protein [Nitrosomonadaceae bacterium]